MVCQSAHISEFMESTGHTPIYPQWNHKIMDLKTSQSFKSSSVLPNWNMFTQRSLAVRVGPAAQSPVTVVQLHFLLSFVFSITFLSFQQSFCTMNIWGFQWILLIGALSPLEMFVLVRSGTTLLCLRFPTKHDKIIWFCLYFFFLPLLQKQFRGSLFSSEKNNGDLHCRFVNCKLVFVHLLFLQKIWQKIFSGKSGEIPASCPPPHRLAALLSLLLQRNSAVSADSSEQKITKNLDIGILILRCGKKCLLDVCTQHQGRGFRLHETCKELDLKQEYDCQNSASSCSARMVGGGGSTSAWLFSAALFSESAVAFLHSFPNKMDNFAFCSPCRFSTLIFLGAANSFLVEFLWGDVHHCLDVPDGRSILVQDLWYTQLFWCGKRQYLHHHHHWVEHNRLYSCFYRHSTQISQCNPSM